MPYTLVQTAPESVEVAKNIESFWFFYTFNIDEGTKKIQIERGYFAAYLCQKSGKPLIESLGVPDAGGDDDSNRTLEISNVGGEKIKIDHARLVNSRFSQFSNEVAQLHLFDLSDDDALKKEWIDFSGWSPRFVNPTKNDDGKYFIKQTVDFDKAKERYVYWFSSQANSNGTERIGVAVPFITDCLMGTLLDLHQEDFPDISISIDDQSWSYPESGESKMQGAVRGFSMVCEGAFKSIALSGEIDDLINQVTSRKTSKEIMSYLSQMIHGYPTPISRTLNTAPATDSNSVIPSDPDLPIEFLYMEDLNRTNPVELIIE